MSTLPSLNIPLSKREQGQDVSEYILLLAFIFLVSACLFLANAGNVSAIWESANSYISHGADPAANSGTAANKVR